MTTTVTVRTHGTPAAVRQIYTAAFNGEHEQAAQAALPVTVPADSEMQFSVFDGVGLLVEEGEQRPVLNDEWFDTATVVKPVSHHHGIHGVE